MATTVNTRFLLTGLLLLIAIGGTGLRLSFNSETFFVQPLQAEASRHFLYAHNLVEHGRFSGEPGDDPSPDALHPPGYPGFVALNIIAAKRLGIDPYELLLHSQVGLAVLSIVLLYLLGRSFLPAFWPLLPALLLALSPHHVSLGAFALADTLFGFTLLFSLFFFVRGCSAHRLSNWLLAGLGLALACLTEPAALLLPPALGLCFALAGTATAGAPLSARQLSILLLPLVVGAGGWSLRTAGIETQAAPLLADKLVIGLYPDYYPRRSEQLQSEGEPEALPGAGVERSYAGFAAEFARRAAADPLALAAWYAAGKPAQLWQWDLLTGQGAIYPYPVVYSTYDISAPARASYSLIQTLHPWLLACALLGAAVLVGRGGEAAAALLASYAALIALSAACLAASAEPRASVPLRPELYLCASYFLCQLTAWLKEVRRRSLERHYASRAGRGSGQRT